MKTKIINITSQGMRAQVTIQNGQPRTLKRSFRTMDEAIQFVLPRGNRQTQFFMNGYKCVLAGWV